MANEKLAAYLADTREKRAQSLHNYYGQPMATCIAHLELLDEIRIETGWELRPEQVKIGSTKEQAIAIAQAKQKASKKRSGVRALKAKYGKEGAEQILEKKTGRHISIR